MYYEKKKPCFWSFANCETGAGGLSQLDRWSQVDRWSLVDRGALVAGGHSEKIKNFIKKGTGQQYFACTWVQDSRIILSA